MSIQHTLRKPLVAHRAAANTNRVDAASVFRHDNSCLVAIGSIVLATSNALVSVHTWWLVVPLVLVQAILFLGLMEAFYHTVHRKLYITTIVNDALGRLTGAHLGFSFIGYRWFHGRHHARANQSDDPENLLCKRQISVVEQLLLPSPHLLKRTMLVKGGDLLRPSDRLIARYERASILMFKICALLLTVLYPVPVVLVYWLPAIVFTYFESIVSQSQHCFCCKAQMAGTSTSLANSLDLNLPKLLAFLSLNRNYLGKHYILPQTKWCAIPTVNSDWRCIGRNSKTMNLSMLLRYWIGAPRRWRLPRPSASV
jgi:fatty acid desaturase